MLLVYNQHPELLYWSKDRRTRTDNNIRFAFLDAMPLVITFTITQPTMKQRDPFSEATDKPSSRLRGKRNLWGPIQ